MLGLGLDGPTVDPEGGGGEGEGVVPVHCTRLTVLPRSGMRLACSNKVAGQRVW